MEEQEKNVKDKGLQFIKAVLLHPHEAMSLLGRDRYKSLKVRLFFLIGTLAGVPLMLVILVGLFWLRNILEEREALYRLADATIETSGRSVAESLKQLQNVYNIS